jgi:hypothetical protein
MELYHRFEVLKQFVQSGINSVRFVVFIPNYCHPMLLIANLNTRNIEADMISGLYVNPMKIFLKGLKFLTVFNLHQKPFKIGDKTSSKFSNKN